MVARSTPDRKVGCSSHSGVKILLKSSLIFFVRFSLNTGVEFPNETVGIYIYIGAMTVGYIKLILCVML